jgi:FlaA1/EpsC-like NDP-sugar epimerase/predicted RNA-binding Zn-ribbon protein involved in translation (DUF1610 family)
MVTGAGGSIGSELCRQVARLGPRRLILYERYENGLHAIAMRLKDEGFSGGLHATIGDITDVGRLDAVMAEHRPEIVFHAAAHKHVPMMEDNVCEAVKNNVTGTRLVAEAAERHGVDRFILISTDKAVNPTSVMGATKRVAELILQLLAPASGTSFCTVRFGNVLASSGSVVPRFLEQIKAGGPVAVTHPEMRRYFMLIPEAVELVLHAAARGQAGQVYVLRMGEQIPVVDVARNLIRLSGFVPDEDIAITFTGMRPGEKLYEELVGPDEAVELSDAPEIMRVQPLRLPTAEALAREVTELERRARAEDVAGVLDQLRAIIPEFKAGSTLPGRTVEMVAVEPTIAAVPRASTHQKCPRCESVEIHRSHPRFWFYRLWRELTPRRPYRCHNCGWRGWLAPFPDVHPVEGLPYADGTVDIASIDSAVEAETRPTRPAFSPRDLG